jgi:hypothetical protein
MKPFAKYLAESERTYQYRIKIVGDVPAGFIKDLESKMSQFDVAKMGSPKTTPVRKNIPDFPAFPNQPLTMVDVEFAIQLSSRRSSSWHSCWAWIPIVL